MGFSTLWGALPGDPVHPLGHWVVARVAVGGGITLRRARLPRIRWTIRDASDWITCDQFSEVGGRDSGTRWLACQSTHWRSGEPARGREFFFILFPTVPSRSCDSSGATAGWNQHRHNAPATMARRAGDVELTLAS